MQGKHRALAAGGRGVRRWGAGCWGSGSLGSRPEPLSAVSCSSEGWRLPQGSPERGWWEQQPRHKPSVLPGGVRVEVRGGGPRCQLASHWQWGHHSSWPPD